MEGPLGRARSDRSQTRTPRREGPPDETRCRPANRPRRAPQGQRDPCSPWESQTARGREGGGRPVCFRRGPPPGACMLTLLPPSRGSAGGSACSGVGLCTSARMPPSLPQRSRAHLTPLSGCSERSLGFSCRGGWGGRGRRRLCENVSLLVPVITHFSPVKGMSSLGAMLGAVLFNTLANTWSRILIPILQVGLRLGNVPRTAEPGLASEAQSTVREAQGPGLGCGPSPSASCEERADEGPVPQPRLRVPAETVPGWPWPVFQFSREQNEAKDTHPSLSGEDANA